MKLASNTFKYASQQMTFHSFLVNHAMGESWHDVTISSSSGSTDLSGTRIRTTDFRTEPYNQKLNEIDGRIFDVKNPDLKKPVKAP